MPRPGWSEAILAQSAIANSLLLPNDGLGIADNQLSIARYQSDTPDAIPLRVTLSPVRRGAGNPVWVAGLTQTQPVRVGGHPAGYAQAATAISANPIYGEPLTAIIEWGVGGNPLNTIVCDWPLGGASIELVASNCQVYGGRAASPPQASQANAPRLQAEIGPSQGMAYNDEPLTFCQTLNLGAEIMAAIPEFARSVVIGIPQPAAVLATDFITVGFFTDTFAGSATWSTVVNEPNTEVPIPGNALCVLVQGNGIFGGNSIQLQWRIAP